MSTRLPSQFTLDDLVSIRPRLDAELTTVAQLARAAHRDDIAGHLEDERLRLDDVGAAKVLVVGETKRGKSSLINALVGIPDLMPVDFDVATGVHVALGYSAEPFARVHILGRDRFEASEISQLSEWITVAGNPGNKKRVKFVEVGVPSSFLQQGILLIDTPGVGGLDAEHARVTMAVLKEADALVFVLEKRAPVSRPELDFLRAASNRIQKVLLVLTKIDQYPAYEQILSEDRRLLSSIHPMFGQIEILPVSSRLAVRSLKETEPDRAAKSLARSGIPVLCERLITEVAVRARRLRYANAMKFLDLAALILDQWYDQFTQESAEQAATKASIDQRAEEYKQLVALAQTWRAHLQEELNTVQRVQFSRLLDAIAATRKSYEIEISMKWQSGRLQSLGRDIEKDLRLALNDYAERLAAGLIEAVDAEISRLGLDDLDVESHHLTFEWRDTADPRALPGISASTTYSLGYRILSGGAGGFAIATLFHITLSTLMPWMLIVAGVGSALSWKESKDAREKQEAQRLLNDVIGTWQRDVSAATEDMTRSTRKSAEQAISARLQERTESVQAQLQLLRQQAVPDERHRQLAVQASAARGGLARARALCAEQLTALGFDKLALPAPPAQTTRSSSPIGRK